MGGASPTAADKGAGTQAQLAAARAAADAARAPKEAAAARRRLLQLTERQLAGGGGGKPSQADTAAAASVAALIAVAEQRLRVCSHMYLHRVPLLCRSRCCVLHDCCDEQKL